ncbi:DUF6414 family protein [Clostridium saudiense]|uniref:DUF6414 family protein n=1 Tax=Clostridium saudiense TaxID=1414720 RepID=UPI002670A916|nr:hypothetical protein [Clostridium saudiense]
MKHFIYLNTDILNSYLSQIDDGIINKSQTEVCDEVTTSSDEEITSKGNKFETKLGLASILGMTFTETPEAVKTTNALSQIESGKELIEKVLHDNAFQRFVTYLNNNDMVKSLESCDIGDYVHFSGEYLVRDVDHILSIFSDEFINFVSENELSKLKIADSLKKNKLKQIKDTYKNTKKIISLAKNTIPEPKFILCNDTFIPLKDKFLRESTPSIRFNYPSKIHVLGKFTSTFSKSTNIEQSTDSFAEVFKSFDNVNKSFYNDAMNIAIDTKVILPIALYFE